MNIPEQNSVADLLLSWKEYVRHYKFKTGRPSEKIFTDAIETERILRNFFNETDFISTKRGFDKDNYLVFLLTSKGENEIHLLNEMAELIKYAQTSHHSFALKSKKDVVAHQELSGVLFEAYVNKFLEGKTLLLEDNSSYLDEKGADKPLDGFFKFANVPYLVECYRPNEPSTKNLLRLSLVLLDTVMQKQIAADQSFIGHIGFKSVKDPIAVFKEATKEALRIFEAYLKAFQTNETITIPSKYNSEQVSVEVLPYYMGNSHDYEYSLHGVEYEILTTFEIRPKPNSYHRSELHVSGKRRVDPELINDKLFKKVEKKIRQHKESTFNKILFIEIDNTPGTNPNNPMFPYITKEHFDRKRFETLINPNIVLVFMFKTVSEKGGVFRDNLWLFSRVHQPLVSILTGK
jgi:hypothetical protein